MSSDVQSAFALQKLNDYSSLAIVIAIGYDYCLIFSKEVAYIWAKPWTSVSVLFLLIRYAGFLSATLWSLFGTTFIPGPEKTHLANLKGNIVYILAIWASALFWAAADMLMILRVYALYGRSRIIFGILFVLFIVRVAFLLVVSSTGSDPKYYTVSTVPLLGTTTCTFGYTAAKWNSVSTITQFVLGIVMFVLVAGRFMRDSLRMYRTKGKWRFNRYMNSLVRDGLLYFFVTLFNGLVNLLGILGISPPGYPFLIIAIDVPLYTLVPRFVINIRELYAFDEAGCYGVDSGFGLSSGTGRGVAVTTIGSMAFAEGEGLEDTVEITT